jgi:hypothetical protein
MGFTPFNPSYGLDGGAPLMHHSSMALATLRAASMLGTIFAEIRPG